MDVSELIPAVERALLVATGEPLRLRVVWVAPDTAASYVVRVEQTGSNSALPHSLIVKAANPELAGDPQQMIFNEWVSLRCLDELSGLAVPFEPGIDDDSEEVTSLVEEHHREFLTLCQGDQNSTRQCIRHDGEHRMIDFGVAGHRHALIEGIPRRMTKTEAAATWSVFHIIWRLPGAMKADRPKGAASLRQQLLA